MFIGISLRVHGVTYSVARSWEMHVVRPVLDTIGLNFSSIYLILEIKEVPNIRKVGQISIRS